jgi:probable HAF family extracellular repeat protein
MMKALVRLVAPASVATLTVLSACADAPATAPVDVSARRPSLAVDPVEGTTVLDLGTLPGFVHHTAWDVNGSGWVVGTAEAAAGPARSAFIWKPGAGMAPLAALAGFSFSAARGINAAGDVAGFSIPGPDNSTPRATLWRAGGVIDLGTLNPASPSALASSATDVNDAGVVVGASETGSTAPNTPVRLAFRWTQGGGMVPLPVPAGTRISEADAINASGQIVGHFQPASGPIRAAMWNGETFIDLGVLPGAVDSRAWGINSAAVVVGTSPNEFPAVRAFRWTQSGGMTQLPAIPGSPPGGFPSAAYGVNDAGDVVGDMALTAQSNPAILWRGQAPYPLPRLTATLEIAVARAINNVGQIAGSVQPATGPTRAVLWTLPTNRQPIADAGGPYAGRKKKEAIAFDGTGSSDPDGDALTYVWDFGDDSPTATGATPTHVYERFGTYTVTLTVSDGRGGTDTATATVDILPPGKLDR